ncbi:MAG TPA: hypothetical protein VJN18_01330, partial [Polyangiaceae bacterium]|nr:hypothetical protein [Polyangiaceae bacterium]
MSNSRLAPRFELAELTIQFLARGALAVGVGSSAVGVGSSAVGVGSSAVGVRASQCGQVSVRLRLTLPAALASAVICDCE